MVSALRVVFVLRFLPPPCAPKWFAGNASLLGCFEAWFVIWVVKDGCFMGGRTLPAWEKKIMSRRGFMTPECQIAVLWCHGFWGSFGGSMGF